MCMAEVPTEALVGYNSTAGKGTSVSRVHMLGKGGVFAMQT